MNFKGDYLRVETPLTSDGVQVITVNGQVQYREDFLPLTARKTLERKNAKLPEGLRKRISVVSNAPYIPQEVRQPKAPVEQISEVTNQPPKAKGGRPKKVQ